MTYTWEEWQLINQVEQPKPASTPFLDSPVITARYKNTLTGATAVYLGRSEQPGEKFGYVRVCTSNVSQGGPEPVLMIKTYRFSLDPHGNEVELLEEECRGWERV